MTKFQRENLDEAIAFRVSKKQKDFLNHQADSRGISVTELIAEALDNYFGPFEKTPKKGRRREKSRG